MSIIRDPIHGGGAGVNRDGQMEIHSSSAEQIHWYSEVKGQAYSVIGTTDTLTAAKVPVLYIKNTSTDKDLIIEQAIMQVVDEVATVPAVGIFWSIELGAVVTGGSAATPVNLNTSSGNTAEATALHSTPTIGTAGSDIRKFYNKAESELYTINAEGAIIIGPNGTYTISYTTTGSAGVATANILFYMEDIGAG